MANIEDIVENEGKEGERRGEEISKVRVYSPRLGREIEYNLRPNNLSEEFYECLGCSNADYGG